MNAARANQKPIDKDQVRMMVADFGYQETAQRLNIKPNTIRQWAKRGHWNKPANTHKQVVTTVTLPSKTVSDAHSEALRELEGQTKLSLAKYARKASQDAEQGTLRDSPLVKNVAQIAGITHNWGDKSNSGNTILNLAVLTGQEKPRRIESSTLDCQSDVLPS